MLAEHLPLQADGYTCTTADLLDVLLGVAANCGTIEAVCADLVGTPDAETIRGYLNEQLRVEDLPELERRLNNALAKELQIAAAQFARRHLLEGCQLAGHVGVHVALRSLAGVNPPNQWPHEADCRRPAQAESAESAEIPTA